MAHSWDAEYRALIAWMKEHTDNPGHDLTGCLHCEMRAMANGTLDDFSPWRKGK